jgi:hypothetical protein
MNRECSENAVFQHDRFEALWLCGNDHRVFVDSAPHFVGNAALTLAAWHGWSGSLRLRSRAPIAQRLSLRRSERRKGVS